MSKTTTSLTKYATVAVIGRPNVGKSTLVNRIIGARRAIVDDMPGVTRDRSYHEAEWMGRHFTLIDTGGIVPTERSGRGTGSGRKRQASDATGDDIHPFADLVNQQVEIARKEADLIVFLVDGQAGILADDQYIAEQLRRSGKPVLLAVNKIDRKEQHGLAAEFYGLGLGEPRMLSALHGDVGVGDLLEEITGRLPSEAMEEPPDGRIRIALVGRPNVGKSSILNSLLGEERAIVSEISGTTRDSIDVRIERDGQEYILVDTAGIRKKGKVDYGIEMFSVDRSIRALREADVTVVVLDATENENNQEGSFVTDQDKKIIEMSNEAGRALVLVVNKWDLIEHKSSKTADQFKKKIYQEIPHASFAPILFVSAVAGQRVNNIYELAKKVYENAQRRIRTALVNEVLTEAFTLSPPPPIKNKRLRLLYATQASVAPPTFILFVNDDKLMKDSYRRYLEKKLRESFEFEGTPLVVIPRPREEKKSPMKSQKIKTQKSPAAEASEAKAAKAKAPAKGKSGPKSGTRAGTRTGPKAGATNKSGSKTRGK